MTPAPWPLREGELGEFLAALEAGETFKAAFEALLLELPEERAEALMLLHREGRGAWLLLLAGGGGPALFVGNGFSGTIAALARVGFEPVVVDRAPGRLAFAAERCAADAGRPPGLVPAPPEGRLPFPDGAFELVVVEPTLEAAPAPSLAECARVAAGELALVAENRLAYKRSAGRRGRFRFPGPRELARRALWPDPGERTLGGHVRALGAAGAGRVRSFALYPHSQDYTHVVSLDAALPRLRIGPKERRNRLKSAGHALGLFPFFTPSFALVASRRAPRPARLERVLAALAERLGEPPQAVEELVATRGNGGLVLTRPRGAHAGEEGDGLCLHVPLSPHQRRLVERHAAALVELARRFPRLPVPELRFAGELEGLWLACERRLGGLTAPQLSGDGERMARTLSDAAQHLAGLVVEPPRPLDERGFEELLGWRFELCARHAARPATAARLAEMRLEARQGLVGRPLPRVLCHGDLRSKHVQARPDGSVLGYLDWGTWEAAGPPLYDLLHLALHERTHADGRSPGEVWRAAALGGRLHAEERAALALYSARVGLEPEVARALAALYPVLVGAMAERTWDYSRPRWLHRQYGL